MLFFNLSNPFIGSIRSNFVEIDRNKLLLILSVLISIHPLRKARTVFPSRGFPLYAMVCTYSKKAKISSLLGWVAGLLLKFSFIGRLESLML